MRLLGEGYGGNPPWEKVAGRILIDPESFAVSGLSVREMEIYIKGKKSEANFKVELT